MGSFWALPSEALTALPIFCPFFTSHGRVNELKKRLMPFPFLPYSIPYHILEQAR